MSKTAKYQCDICDKQFIQKSDYDKHKNKKNACVPLSKLNEITNENKKLKEELETKQKHDTMKNNLTNLFKWCLDLLRDQEHLVGDKALRTIAYFLILRLSEAQIDSGTIDIDNIDHYNKEECEEDDIKRYMNYARFSVLNQEKEANMTERVKNLWDVILSKHPKFKDLFVSGDSFRIKHDSTFKKIISRLTEFSFEDYEADIQGEAYEEVVKDIMIGKTLGQFFTPPLMKRFMIDLIDPQVKEDGTVETIFDPAMGTGGFLITSLRHYIRQAREKDIKLNWDFISKQGVGGREAEPDTFQLAKANMLISSGHTFETLERDDSIRNPIQKKYDIILANPPFGIKGLKYNEIQNNDIIKKEHYIPIASNSAIPLFLQAMIYMLKVGGRCATVIPNGQELFNKGDGLVAIREYLMKTCNLKEIIMMPPDMFNNTGVKTCVFYFEKKKEGIDVLETATKAKKQTYEFEEEHTTKKVKFYDYDPIKKEKKLLVEVNIKDIAKNSYSLNYSEYVKGEEKKYDDSIEIKTLNELCKVITGEYITKTSVKQGKYPVYGGGDASYFIEKYNRENTLVINKDGVSENCVRFVNGKFFLNHHGWTLQIINSNIFDKFLFSYLINNQHTIYDLAKGAAQKGINQENFYKIKIPVPSLDLQKEIVEQLDFLHETIERSEKKVDDLKRINKIIMNNQIQYGDNESKKLKEICEYIKTGKNKPSDNKQGTKYPYYGTSGITGYTDEYLFDGQFLLTARNGTIGNTFLTNGKIFPSDHMFVLNIKNECNIKYIHYLLTSYNLENITHGATIPGITKTDLEKIVLNIPVLEKQKELVTKLEQNDNIIAQLRKEIESNKELAKEIMNNILKEKKKDAIDMDDNNVEQDKLLNKKQEDSSSNVDDIDNIDINDNEQKNELKDEPKNEIKDESKNESKVKQKKNSNKKIIVVGKKKQKNRISATSLDKRE